MGCSLTVLLPVKNRYENSTVQEIHDDLINHRLFIDIGDQIDYFSFWDASYNEDFSFLGKNEPERIKKRAAAWNQLIADTLKIELDEVLKHDSSNDVISSFEKDRVSAYRLQLALNLYTDQFQHGSDWLVYDEDDCTSTKIPKHMQDDIMVHPEDYAIIEVVYH